MSNRMTKFAAIATIAMGTAAPMAMATTMSATQGATVQTSKPTNLPREKKSPVGMTAAAKVTAPGNMPREKKAESAETTDVTGASTIVKSVPVGPNAKVGSGLNGTGPVGNN